MSTYPEAYIDYLIEFHGSRDFFECHEIMEDFWKEHTEPHWLTLIQLAVAVYHERQNNLAGSLRMYKKVYQYLENKESQQLEQLGIDTKELKRLVRERINGIENQFKYQPFNLPIKISLF